MNEDNVVRRVLLDGETYSFRRINMGAVRRAQHRTAALKAPTEQISRIDSAVATLFELCLERKVLDFEYFEDQIPIENNWLILLMKDLGMETEASGEPRPFESSPMPNGSDSKPSQESASECQPGNSTTLAPTNGTPLLGQEST